MYDSGGFVDEELHLENTVIAVDQEPDYGQCLVAKGRVVTADYLGVIVAVGVHEKNILLAGSEWEKSMGVECLFSGADCRDDVAHVARGHVEFRGNLGL